MQLTALAEAFGEQLTLERVDIYVGGLADLSQDQLRAAFRRALYELKWFPKLAELRDLAGSKTEELKVEAQAAWNYVNDYLRKWGVDRLPVRSGEKLISAPPLAPRLEYAVRQIGGLWRLNQVTDQNYHFIFRDFCDAYALAPLAELMEPQLLEKFNIPELASQVREFPQADPRHELTPGEVSQAEELTPERREQLRQKLQKELAGRGIPRRAGGLH